MRRRKWVLVLAAVAISIIAGWYFTWRAIRADERIKGLLLESIRPFLAQESDIEKVKVDFHSLHLRGVKLAPKDRSFYLDIEEVRLSYKFWNLVKYRFTPHKLVHEVVLVRPVLNIRKDFTEIQAKAPKEIWLDPRKVVEELEVVRRVTVVDAEAFAIDSTGERVRLAHSMNGRLEAIPTDSAFIRLTGKLFETKDKNLRVEGRLNLLTGSAYGMRVRIDESEIGSKLPFFIPDFILVEGGRIKGEVLFDRSKESSGYLEFLDGSFSIKNANIVIEKINVKGTVKGTDIFLAGNIQNFNGSPQTFSGAIMDAFRDPHLDLSVHCARLDIPEFFDHAAPETRLPLSGEARFQFHYSGSLNNPNMTGDFISSNLHVYGIDFKHFGATVGLKDSVFMIEGEGKQEGGLALTLKAEMDFSDTLQTTVLAVDVGGNVLPVLPHWSQNWMKDCEGEIGIRMYGELRNLQGEANGELLFDWGEDKILRLIPNFWYNNKDLHVEVESNNGFSLNGDFQSLFFANPQWGIQVKGLDALLEPLTAGTIRNFLDQVDIDGTISGTSDGWGVWLEGYHPQQRELPVLFEMGLTSGGEEKKRGEVELRAVYFGPEGRELPLLAKGTVSEKNIELNHCEIGDFISIEGSYPLGTEGELRGKIELSDFYLEKIHGIFPSLEPYLGEIRGGIEITGTRSEPEVDLEVSLREGRFHSVGVFDGRLDYLWDSGKIRLSQISFRKDGIPILAGKAEWVKGDSLVGGFTGEGIDFGEIILAFTGKDFFTGEGNVDFSVTGRIDTPLVRGRITVKDGMVGPISFRELKTEVVDTLSERFDFGGGRFSIQNGLLERDDGLEVQFWGNLPEGNRTDGDISILAQGNILGVFPEISGAFKKAEGSGEVFLRLAGRSGEWEMGDGWMRLDDGRFELTEFIEEIEKLQGEAKLLQEERFIHILNFSGEIDGEKFSISNRPVEEGTNELYPLIINRLSVHLGVLQFQTMGKGIRVHLPGFMENGEKGWLAFDGKEAGEKFSIAGPVESPLFQGSLHLTDHRLTYPFLSVEKDTVTSNVLDFLTRINWDLRIVPKKDVHYVRNIESPLGVVYMDLLLRNDYGEMRLEGIIEEEDFQVWGNLLSMEGSIEVFDLYFKPERILFDYPKGATDPIISGRAFTTVIDSMGMPSTVWLSLAEVDNVTGFQKKGGPWGKVQFRFSSDNPNLGRTEADLLAALGYSTENMKDRAYDALGMQVENVVFRPIFRPLERRLRRYLGLDVVRFSSMFSRNIVQMRVSNNPSFNPKFLLRSSKLTLGKYLAPGLFLIYSGQVQQGMGLHYHTHGLGFRHALSLEYTIRPDLFLQMEYTYDSQLLSDRREDKRIWLRHIFPF